MTENQVDRLIDPGDNRSQHNDQDQPRTLRDFMNPTRTGALSCIVYPPNASHFHFRPVSGLSFFPFSLKDKAKTWLQNLRSGSIRSWDELQEQFLKKFFPPHRTNSFKRQITTFTQKLGETLYQCWERYKELLNSCPHHGFETRRFVSHFYEGLTPQCRQMVEMMCNGEFSDKDPEEALEYLDLLAENAQNWDTASTYEAPT
ncbi:hypothetical protein Q3G72_012337 [Acer saccharum]|nr:hypothetical protein Q3G72_012337 [Acer saccharum]